MSMTRIVLGAGVVVAVAVGAYMLGGEKARATQASVKAAPEVKSAPASGGGFSASAPAAAPMAAPKAPARVVANNMSALMADMSRGKYQAVYERIGALAERTPEENYALAQILAQCGKGPGSGEAGGFVMNVSALRGEGRRQQLAAAISEKDPDRDRRLAAFDAIHTDPCSGLEKLQVKRGEALALIAAAAAAGHPQARAHQVQMELWEQMRGPRNPGEGPRAMRISDAQLDTLRDVMRSSDPGGVVMAARILSNPTMADFSLRVGPSESTIDGSAFATAAQLIACDLGDLCGADSPRVLESCALYGNCNAADLREHIFYYGSSAASAQNAQVYYNELQRARSGDWSYFNFNRGPGTRFVTSPRPR